MRPRFLTVEGLACFRDKQEIDLSGLDLFAISGPTGAGKSTLLDAMTFALYGEVPRVDDKNRSEMISATRDRVSVSLDFDVGAERYRVVRTLRRSGGGVVRLEKHDGQGFNVNLADQVRTADKKIEEILGLDASAFLQAVVLPQGEFAKFLKAEPRHRREMLRSLLRLEVYEQMRVVAQRLASEKKNTVESQRRMLNEEYLGVDDVGLADAESRLNRTTESLGALRAKRDAAQKTLDGLRTQHNTTVELGRNEAKHKQLLESTGRIDKTRKQIELATRAAPILSFLQEADRAGNEATLAAKRKEAAETEEKKAQANYATKLSALEAAEKAGRSIPDLRTKVAQLNRIAGSLAEAKQLEETIRRQSEDIKSLTGELARLAAAIKTAQAAQVAHATAVRTAQASMNAAQYDAKLHRQLDALRNRAIELSVSRRRSVEASAELVQKRQEGEDRQAKLGPVEKKAQAAAEAVKHSQRDVRNAEAKLYGARNLDAANSLRHTLEPDGTCPVCEQTVATPPAANLNPKVAAAEQALSGAQKQLELAESEARSARDALTRALADVDSERKSLASLDRRYSELEQTVKTEERAIRAALSAHLTSDGGNVETWIETRVLSLTKSRDLQEQAKGRLQEAERAVEAAKAEERSARTRLEDRTATRGQLEQERKLNEERRVALREEVSAVTKSDDPIAEAAALVKRTEGLEATLKAASIEAADAKSRLALAEETLRLTAEAANKAQEEAEMRGMHRDEQLARSAFSDGSSVLAAILDPAKLTELREQVLRYDQELHAVQQRINALRGELGDVRVSDDELADADKAAKTLSAESESVIGEQKRLEERVAVMKLRLEKAKKLRSDLEANEVSLRIHNQLASDLRSDKFQAYLLEEAFTELVQGASVRLFSLTDQRYSLIFKDNEILVVDNDNAGETRISDTLSGGETFLTSLSLALELSNQVQRAAGAINLDSLFIDEGFGTLDPDTLAVVSETIQSLRAGGRMVGIITHIPELRDEFAQQIVVTKHQGFSSVEVRGVEREPALG